MKKELVNHPAHYMNSSGVECITIAKHMRFSSGNALKYIYRLGEKDDMLQELNKALFYLKIAAEEHEYNDYPEDIDIRGLYYKISKYQPQPISNAMLCIYLGDWAAASEYVQEYIDNLA